MCATRNEAGETSICAPTGRSLNREEEAARRLAEMEGAGVRKGAKKDFGVRFAGDLSSLGGAEILTSESCRTPIKTSCHPVFFLCDVE